MKVDTFLHKQVNKKTVLSNRCKKKWQSYKAGYILKNFLF